MTKLTRIEEVKKILRKHITYGSYDVMGAAKEICQLFPQPLPDFVGEKEAVTQCEPQPRDDKELREELRIGKKLTADLTDKCRELEQKIEEAKREERERIGLIIDSYMAHGKYKAPFDDTFVNCSSGDVEYIWKQIKQALKGGE